MELFRREKTTKFLQLCVPTGNPNRASPLKHGIRLSFVPTKNADVALKTPCLQNDASGGNASLK